MVQGTSTGLGVFLTEESPGEYFSYLVQHSCQQDTVIIYTIHLDTQQEIKNFRCKDLHIIVDTRDVDRLLISVSLYTRWTVESQS